MKKLLLLLTLIVFNASSYAQESVQDTLATNSNAQKSPKDTLVKNIYNLDAEDYKHLTLPSLEEILENIQKNPSVKFYNARIEEQDLMLKEIRRSWLKFVRVSANVQYGITNDLTTFEESSNYPVISRYSGRLEFLYGVGATLAVPIDEVIGKRNKVRMQKTRIAVAQSEMEIWRDNQILLIIDAYSDVVEQLSIIKELANTVIIAKAQYAATENDFINAQAKQSELTSQKTILTKAVIEYERCRSVLNRAILKLELIGRTEIIK